MCQRRKNYAKNLKGDKIMNKLLINGKVSENHFKVFQF